MRRVVQTGRVSKQARSEATDWKEEAYMHRALFLFVSSYLDVSPCETQRIRLFVSLSPSQSLITALLSDSLFVPARFVRSLCRLRRYRCLEGQEYLKLT